MLEFLIARNLEVENTNELNTARITDFDSDGGFPRFMSDASEMAFYTILI